MFQIYVRASAADVWRSITEAEFTRRYFHDTAVETDWQPGSPVIFRQDDGSVAVEGKVLEVDEPTRLVMTWEFKYSPDVANDPPSRVTWEIEPLGESGDVCRLTVLHDEFDGETETYKVTGNGWVPLLSSLKSLLETGEPLELPG